eukprot:465143-Hanusia_phi.AAC.4
MALSHRLLAEASARPQQTTECEEDGNQACARREGKPDEDDAAASLALSPGRGRGRELGEGVESGGGQARGCPCKQAQLHADWWAAGHFRDVACKKGAGDRGRRRRGEEAGEEAAGRAGLVARAGYPSRFASESQAIEPLYTPRGEFEGRREVEGVGRGASGAGGRSCWWLRWWW